MNLLRPLCIALWVAGTVSSVSAASTYHYYPVYIPYTPSASKTNTPFPLSFRGTVTAVDTAAKTITVENSQRQVSYITNPTKPANRGLLQTNQTQSQVIHVTDQTRIWNDKYNERATFRDIPIGAKVNGASKSATEIGEADYLCIESDIRTSHFRGTVTAVDPVAKTITVKQSGHAPYSIMAFLAGITLSYTPIREGPRNLKLSITDQTRLTGDFGWPTPFENFTIGAKVGGTRN